MLTVSGCATTSKPVQQVVKRDAKLQKQLNDLQDQDYRLTFLLNMNVCFTFYNKCMIKVQNGPKCWAHHEKCVINTNQMYKTVQEKAKERRSNGE